MSIARPAASSHELRLSTTRWIRRSLELLWLLTVVAVPLAFVDRESFLSELELAYVDVPKTVLLRTLVGLMAVLWLIEWVLQRWFVLENPLPEGREYFDPRTWPRILIAWIRIQPNRLVTLAVVLYLGSTLLSTALSESPTVSIWGLVPGQDTYPAYTVISYVVLFAVVSTHVKGIVQVQRLLWAVVLMGVLVGGYSWAQFYGHDVFSLREIPSGARSGSTMGNSILAGAVLLMTITVSLASATIALGQPVRSGRFWGIFGLWTLILTVQMTALVFASSRGPWGGTVVGLVALIGLVAVFLGWRTFLRMALVLGLAAGLSAVIVLVPPPIPTGGAIKITIHEYMPPAEARNLASKTYSQAISIGDEIERGVGGGGLSGRLEIWETSGRLMWQRPWFESDSPGLRFARLLIGYGPDMFKYTYLLERVPRGQNGSLNSERFAHNLLVHRGVELGLFGLLTTLGLFAAPFLVGGYQLFRRGHGDSTFYILVRVGLAATLVGRFVEQMVGVAAVSDLMVSWVLLGLFVALTPVAEGVSQTAPQPPQTSLRQQQRRQRKPSVNTRIPGLRALPPAALAVCLIFGISLLSWTKSVNYLAAGFNAREGLESILDSEFQNSLASLDRAIDLAPDVSVYHTLRAAVYSGYRREYDGPREPGCDRSTDAVPYDICLARMSYLSHLDAAEQRTFDWRLHLNLAESELTLALMEQDSDMAAEAIGLFREVAQLDPQAWWHWYRLAAAHIKVGQPKAALDPLERSLAILDGAPRAASPRLLQGIAYLQLDEPSMALRSFDESIRINPNSADAYTNRGNTYNALGQYQRAIQDLDEAIELNPKTAMAYNNRGNSYGNLNQFQRAIEDYDEAIHLDPGSALAYFNRALAYAYLGRDEDARMDVDRRTELGFDANPLFAKLKEIREAR